MTEEKLNSEIKKLESRLDKLYDERRHKDWGPYFNLKGKYFKYKDDYIYVWECFQHGYDFILRAFSFSSEFTPYWDANDYFLTSAHDITIKYCSSAEQIKEFVEISEEEFKKTFTKSVEDLIDNFEKLLEATKKWAQK